MGGVSELNSVSGAFLKSREAVLEQQPFSPPVGRLPNGRVVAVVGPAILHLDRARLLFVNLHHRADVYEINEGGNIREVVNIKNLLNKN